MTSLSLRGFRSLDPTTYGGSLTRISVGMVGLSGFRVAAEWRLPAILHPRPAGPPHQHACNGSSSDASAQFSTGTRRTQRSRGESFGRLAIPQRPALLPQAVQKKTMSNDQTRRPSIIRFCARRRRPPALGPRLRALEQRVMGAGPALCPGTQSVRAARGARFGCGFARDP